MFRQSLDQGDRLKGITVEHVAAVGLNLAGDTRKKDAFGERPEYVLMEPVRSGSDDGRRMQVAVDLLALDQVNERLNLPGDKAHCKTDVVQTLRVCGAIDQP